MGDLTPNRILAAASILVPVSSFLIAEWSVVRTATGTDRPYAIRFTGSVAWVELAAFALLAALLSAAIRPEGSGRLRRLLPAIATATATALAALYMLSNGFPPYLKLASTSPEKTAAIAAAAALVAGLVRLASTRGAPGVAATLLGPMLLAPALVATYEAERGHGVPPSSARGLVLLLLGAGTVWIAAASSNRLSGNRKDLVAGLAAAGVLAGALATASLGVVLGRTPFPSLPPKPDAPPDVLILLVDTVRADAWPASWPAALPTPAAARMVATGRRYTEVFSTSCWTAPAHASIFTGLDSDVHGTGWESSALDRRFRTLAERFRDAGYRTGGFSSNAWITPELGYDRGFDRFENAAVERKPRRPWPLHLFPRWFGRFDASLLYEDKGGMSVASETLRFLGEEPTRPAFVFANLLESHLPYRPPERWMRRLEAPGWNRNDLDRVDLTPFRDLQPGGARTPREIDGLRRLYSAAVAYDDDLVGRILGGLEAAGRLDRTIVAVVSDHGENVGEHLALDHQLGLWDSLLRVPLVIRFPATLPPGEAEPRMASLSDLPGALLHLAGIESDLPPGPLIAPPGRDRVFFYYDRPGHILDLLRNVYHVDPAPYDRTLHGVRTADRKWIEGSDGRHEAYDLVADPGETRNLFDGRGVPAGFEALAEALASRRGDGEAAGTKRAPKLSDETLERLRSLGYVR